MFVCGKSETGGAVKTVATLCPRATANVPDFHGVLKATGTHATSLRSEYPAPSRGKPVTMVEHGNVDPADHASHK